MKTKYISFIVAIFTLATSAFAGDKEMVEQALRANGYAPTNIEIGNANPLHHIINVTNLFDKAIGRDYWRFKTVTFSVGDHDYDCIVGFVEGRSKRKYVELESCNQNFFSSTQFIEPTPVKDVTPADKGVARMLEQAASKVVMTSAK